VSMPVLSPLLRTAQNSSRGERWLRLFSRACFLHYLTHLDDSEKMIRREMIAA
jgi:hypothetical protein